MDLTYFQTFREVAKRQSFTRAAEELGYAQSSVTMQIQKLEREYGVSLFERHGRLLRLTPPGEVLLKLAVQMLDLYAQSKEIVGNQVGGTLTIGTIDSLAAYYLPPYLQQLRERFPELNIHIQAERESLIVSKVKEGEFDIGLLLDGKPVDPALRCETIREEPLVLTAPPGHPLTQLSGGVSVDHLNGVELIMSEESCNYRGMFENVLRAHNVSFLIRFELGNPEAIKQCVMNGLGVALLPQIVVEEEVRRGRLKVLPFVHPDIRFDLQLFVHPKKWMSQPLLAFIRLLKP
ncbi:LysR family transcriptional regulator [Paenibacillus tyrfis]|uniref:LysR family transcriptional regulator n=1 Tax=Paenibacillus tyrfis TaxID=1501230 RepID=UPI00209D5106|nr:LysR family transcriptional regulator [Paenibacillus tyrfis]MCP1310197.1 LysR family transcriptional regulator [Paenibacillus tyrfis]